MRHEFSAKTKVQAFKRCGGFCEGIVAGQRCGVRLATGKFRYDHRIPDWMGGDNSLENCQVLGLCCDSIKTPQDQRDIAKTKRREINHLGAKVSKGRPIMGSKRSGFRRKMNGEIVRRHD